MDVNAQTTEATEIAGGSQSSLTEVACWLGVEICEKELPGMVKFYCASRVGDEVDQVM